MRGLTAADDGERGGISVIVAVMMVALLGFAAVAVDVGVLYSERAQLQNGADAAALGLAQKCARDELDAQCTSTSSLAAELVNKNAVDGLSNVKSLTVDKPNRRVTVIGGAQEAGKTANQVSLYFAGVLGSTTAEVTAKTIVEWGSPQRGTTPFPLTISVCQVQSMIDGATQLLRSHTTNANPDCPAGPSGADTPGGFGWITQDPGSCGGYIDLAVNEGGSDTGNDGPSNCDAILNGWAAEINAGRDVTVLLPVFNSVTGTGSGASFDVTDFAAFNVKGWKFSGGTNLPPNFRNTSTDAGALACTGECRGIIGKFVTYVSLADGYVLGPLNPYGATVVQLKS